MAGERIGVYGDDSRRLVRRSLILAAAVALSGCATLRNSPFFGTIVDFNKSAGPAISRARVESTPFASLIAHFKGGAPALLALGEYAPQQRLIWYSAEKQSVTTWGPFVERVLGLDVELRATTFEGMWSTDLRTMVGRTASRSFDFKSRSKVTTVRVESSFRDAGHETIEILGVLRDLRRIKERAIASGRHRYTNTYWIDANGFCWKSEQLVIPTSTKFSIQITKAPKGA